MVVYMTIKLGKLKGAGELAMFDVPQKISGSRGSCSYTDVRGTQLVCVTFGGGEPYAQTVFRMSVYAHHAH